MKSDAKHCEPLFIISAPSTTAQWRAVPAWRRSWRPSMLPITVAAVVVPTVEKRLILNVPLKKRTFNVTIDEMLLIFSKFEFITF